MEYKWVMIANCIIWLSTAAGAIAGLMITKNANCLWFNLIYFEEINLSKWLRF